MNYKSLLLEWSQQEKKKIEFRVSDVPTKNHVRQYRVDVFVESEPYASAVDFTIKGAEKLASAKTWDILKGTVENFCLQKRKELL